MSVTIRLTRAGSKKVPFYRVVAADHLSKWYGQVIGRGPKEAAAAPTDGTRNDIGIGHDECDVADGA